MSTTQIESVELPTGVTLPYVEQGDPDGIPMLLLHGYSDSWRSFEQTLEHLPDSIHAVALTQRGHGDAERPVSGYRIADFAADAAALIDALDLGPSIVVGSSLGSSITQGMLVEHGDRLLGAALVAAFGPARENDAAIELEAVVATLTDPVDREFVHEFQASTTARPLPDAVLDAFVDESMKLPARVWKAVCDGFMDFDPSQQLTAVETPTAILWGDRDAYATRDEQDWLASTIPGARLSVYEGAGHAIHWEEPERFAADITAFAKEVAER